MPPNKIAIAICGVFVLLALQFAAATPVFEAPDEAGHFLYIHNLLRERSLPTLEGRDEVFASGSTQRHHPPLYYLIGALLVGSTRRIDVVEYLQPNPFASIGVVSPNNQNVYLHPLRYSGDTALAVRVLRRYSIVLSVITLLFIYGAVWIAFRRGWIAAAAMLFTAVLPGFVFIGSSINNDNMVTMFYAAGVYLALRVLQRRTFAAWEVGAAGIVLAGAALSKLTGLTLYGVVYLSVLYGLARGWSSWRRAALYIFGSLAVSAALAGWWFVRNIDLYGDPLALNATLGVWGRGGAPGLDEIRGVWDSFWMTLGYMNVRGPDWLYPYAGVLTVAGIIGALLIALRRPDTRIALVALVGVCGLVGISVLLATLQINVSQGRLLYPALVGLAPLLAAGWYSIFGRRVGALLILPLAYVTIIAPVTYIAEAYSPIRETAAPIPNRLNLRSEGLWLLDYENSSRVVRPGDLVRVTFYLLGTNLENPAMFVKALDPVTQEVLGGVDFYPGMSPTNRLTQSQTYQASVAFRLSSDSSEERPTLQLRLQVGWRVPETQRVLEWYNGEGRLIPTVLLDGPILIGRQPPPPQVAADVVFGGRIGLAGYTLSSDTLSPGGTLEVTFNWRYIAQPDKDYTVAFGLLDAANTVVAQADGMPEGYPTSAWQPGPDTPDSRRLTLPADMPSGEYRLYVGWYDAESGARLPAKGQGTEGDLFVVPIQVE